MIVFLVFLIVLSSFFSGVEVALVSISRIKVRGLVYHKRHGAESLMRLKENPDRMLTTILIGNNVVNVAASALATVLATDMFGYLGVGIATGVMTLLLLVFGEITPKTLAASHNVTIALAVAKPILALQLLMYPVLIVFESISKLVNKIFGGNAKPILTEEELKTIVKVGYEEKILDLKDREIIEGVIRFDDIEVGDVMTPYSRMFSLGAKVTVREALDEVSKTRFSRIPVYVEGKKDVILGVVHIRDLIRVSRKDENMPISDIARNPYLTLKETKINDLFIEMQKKHQHIALVVGKKGSVEGLITLENLLEEIVGEIMDESDASQEMIVKIDKKTYKVNGELQVDELEEYLNVEFKPLEKHMSVADLLHQNITEKPQKGSQFTLSGIQFTVEEYEDHKPLKIKVTIGD